MDSSNPFVSGQKTSPILDGFAKGLNPRKKLKFVSPRGFINMDECRDQKEAQYHSTEHVEAATARTARLSRPLYNSGTGGKVVRRASA